MVKKEQIRHLKECTIVGCSSNAAAQIAAKGTFREFEAGATLIEAGDVSESVFFILTGRTKILVNGRQLAERVAGQTVGEMAAIDPAASRSAKVVAAGNVQAVEIGAADFCKIARRHPDMYRRVACELGERLRQRNNLIPPVNDVPRAILLSAKDDLKFMTALKQALESRGGVECQVWTEDDIFQSGENAMEALERQLDRVDFAIANANGVDRTVDSDGNDQMSPRDNIVFEIGLFMGRLGRRRTLYFFDGECKLPSDLRGITDLRYREADVGSDETPPEHIAKKVISHIKRLGPHREVRTYESEDSNGLG
jgi:predicted nucleotide-binding protein